MTSRQRLESYEGAKASAQSAARTGCPCHKATASSRVARARGCFGSLPSWAFRIVSLGPVIATTRVAVEPGAMPIQIDFMSRLLSERLDRHRDGGALRGGDDRRRANFSATHVRFFLSLSLTPASRPLRRCQPTVTAQPVPPLTLLALPATLGIVTAIRAVHLAPIAATTQMKHLPASVESALNLPKIVHSRATPQTTRPPS